MTLPILLFCLPLVTAVLLFAVRKESFRNLLVRVSAALMMALSLALSVVGFGEPLRLTAAGEWIHVLLMSVDVICVLLVLYYSWKFKRPTIAFLGALQFVILAGFDFASGLHISTKADFVIDHFTIIMVLIVGVIGGLITVYSLGYMQMFQKNHADAPDRRFFFFFTVFVFLSAMFGLVMSNNLIFMYTFWEVTSLCSFLLIGYTKSNEAIHNSCKALWMNLFGGLAFALAIVWMGMTYGTVELSELVRLGRMGLPVEPAVMLLVFCGFTKSAMMPFSGWLLGAMIAPTPTSALLHSSTMVKAGVFLIIKLCPLMGANHVGVMAMLVGGATFFFASCAAISQSDGKKVLAYSTISNLGLIVCCAGTGSYEAAWTAVMIVIFHAVAKSLLFLTVGTAEQQLGSRNLESFDGVFNSMPRLTLCMVIGICGMFLAPFGMLISKWAAMKAFVDAAQPMLLLVLVYGSATTLFYWTKWLGKITTYIPTNENREIGILPVEWIALKSLSLLTLVVCVLFPLISQYMVMPYLAETYHHVTDVIAQSNLWIMSIMVFLLILLCMRFGKEHRHRGKVITNLSGENLGADIAYRGVGGHVVPVSLRNWYLERWFGEEWVKRIGYTACLGCVILELALTLGGMLHV